jgi:glutamate--cysteine ligase catalytic subunit
MAVRGVLRQTAQRRGAVLNERFYFRRDVAGHLCADPRTAPAADPDAYELMTLDEIINGREGGFSGLVPLIELYLNALNIDVASRRSVCRYLHLISLRASGAAQTPATFIREFVANHPAYRHGAALYGE